MAHITTGINNSAFGTNALNKLTTGNNNAAQGNSALSSLIDGNTNTAFGVLALHLNVSGDFNTAVGYRALEHSTSNVNTAVGYRALNANTTGAGNTAVGVLALFDGITGSTNTAVGQEALRSTSGSSNTALGFQAAGFVLSASGVVCIGAGMGGANVNNTTYIRNVNTTVQPVTAGVVDLVTVRLSDSRLGRNASSQRYKENITPMDTASEVLYQLKPVTYRYKKDIDPTQSLDYGLVAEDVAKIDPKLAIRDGDGHIESVRYMAIYNMLLNEFLKEHRTVQELKSIAARQEANAAKQEAMIAQQQKQIEALTAGLQKVSTQVEASKPVPQLADNDQ